MIDAYRMIFADGYVSYWHCFGPFIDLMVAAAAETDTFTLESRTFPNEETMDWANDQHGLG